ncbi:MAG: HAD-IIA family hydrolase [Chloroflexi bacterium]|nr:HAD-IIA family hydrolase [Chloroflexota bacterium]
MTLLPHTTKGLILDMDGVLWTDSAPIGDLPRIFARIKELNLAVAMATNNSTRTVDQYVERLHDFGVDVEPWQVITSSLAVAEMMKRKLPAGSPVFAIGEQGLIDALKDANFELLSTDEAERAQAVVIGLDRRIDFDKMREATLLVRAGIPFFATNPDKTFPTPRGQIPGAGAWISVIVIASEVEPMYAGKPYPYILELALERLGTPKEATYVVGDRLETDIAGGQGMGCPTSLVLSGVGTQAQADAWLPKIDIISADLTALVGA